VIAHKARTNPADTRTFISPAPICQSLPAHAQDGRGFAFVYQITGTEGDRIGRFGIVRGHRCVPCDAGNTGGKHMLRHAPCGRSQLRFEIRNCDLVAAEKAIVP